MIDSFLESTKNEYLSKRTNSCSSNHSLSHIAELKDYGSSLKSNNSITSIGNSGLLSQPLFSYKSNSPSLHQSQDSKDGKDISSNISTTPKPRHKKRKNLFELQEAKKKIITR